MRYMVLYISLPSSTKQQREMTKFKVLWRTCEHTPVIFHSPSLLERHSYQFKFPDTSPTLSWQVERTGILLKLLFKLTFSLPLPSSLLKLPITSGNAPIMYDEQEGGNACLILCPFSRPTMYNCCGSVCSIRFMMHAYVHVLIMNLIA